MDGTQVLMLGLGIQEPWKLVNQHLDMSSSPNELVLEIEAERGSLNSMLQFFLIDNHAA